MDVHLRDDEIRAALGRGAEARLVQHLYQCERCRARGFELLAFSDRAGGLRAQLGVEDSEHLAFEELTAAADGEPIAEGATEHLAECEPCRREVADLREFARQYAREAPGRPAVGGRVLLAAAAALVVVAAIAWWERQARAPRPLPVAGSAGEVRAAATPAMPLAGVQVLLRDAHGDIRREDDGTLSGVPGAHAAAVAAILEGAPLPAAAILRDLGGNRETLRGTVTDPSTVRLEQPLGVVETATPRFSWHGSPEGSYQVEVFDEDLRQVAGAEVQGLSWSATAPLPRGRTYGWQLRVGDAVYPRPPEPPARFHVLDGEAVAELAAARRSGSHLAAAVVLARHGLTAEAVEHVQALAELNPGEALPRRLLAELLARDRPQR